jgi:hypothetical protein
MNNAEATFNRNTNNELKKYNTLKDCFQKIHKQEDNLYKSSVKAFTQINQIEDNPELKSIYSSFVNKMNNLEGKRKEQLITKLNNHIIPGITFNASQIKKYKTNPQLLLQKNEQERNRENAAQNETAQNFAPPKGDKELLLFEMESQAYNKSLLLHVIHSEIAWHSSALQGLGELYKEILGMDPCKNIQNFRDSNNLNVGDLKNFYDPDELNGSKRSQKEENISEHNSNRINNNDNVRNQEQNQQ